MNKGPVPGTICQPGSYRGWLSVAKPGDTWWTDRPIYNMYTAAKSTKRKIHCKKFLAFSLRGFGLKNGESIRLVQVTILK